MNRNVRQLFSELYKVFQKIIGVIYDILSTSQRLQYFNALQAFQLGFSSHRAIVFDVH